MNDAKNEMIKMITQQPEDAGFDEILCQLILHSMARNGLDAPEYGKFISSVDKDKDKSSR